MADYLEDGELTDDDFLGVKLPPNPLKEKKTDFHKSALNEKHPPLHNNDKLGYFYN